MIKNQSKGNLLAPSCTLCSSFFSRAKGLMFSREPRALVMAFPKEQKIGIHMMFVFFPIDVLWLDDEQHVVAMRENLAPWKTASPQEAAKYVIELPSGAIKASGTTLGDEITWVCV